MSTEIMKIGVHGVEYEELGDTASVYAHGHEGVVRDTHTLYGYENR